MHKVNLLSRAKIIEQSAVKLVVRLSLFDFPEYFQGHFPKHEVLPGVIQLAWVKELAGVWFGEDFFLRDINQMKFMIPLNSQHTLETIIARASEQERRFSFSYYIVKASGGRVLASQGKGLL